MYITVRPGRARDTWTSIGTAAGLLLLVLLGAFLAEIRVERSGDGRWESLALQRKTFAAAAISKQYARSSSSSGTESGDLGVRQVTSKPAEVTAEGAAEGQEKGINNNAAALSATHAKPNDHDIDGWSTDRVREGGKRGGLAKRSSVFGRSQVGRENDDLNGTARVSEPNPQAQDVRHQKIDPVHTSGESGMEGGVNGRGSVHQQSPQTLVVATDSSIDRSLEDKPWQGSVHKKAEEQTEGVSPARGTREHSLSTEGKVETDLYSKEKRRGSLLSASDVAGIQSQPTNMEGGTTNGQRFGQNGQRRKRAMDQTSKEEAVGGLPLGQDAQQDNGGAGSKSGEDVQGFGSTTGERQGQGLEGKGSGLSAGNVGVGGALHVQAGPKEVTGVDNPGVNSSGLASPKLLEPQCPRHEVSQLLLDRHACVLEHDICVDMGRFIVRNPKKRPGLNFTWGPIIDPGPTYYNLPGFNDIIKGTKMAYHTPQFRGNSSMDPEDIADPVFISCTVPLVWWPHWPFNWGEFYMQSVLPLHLMHDEGVFGRNVKFIPVLEGYRMPPYFQTLLEVMSMHKVERLDDLSTRPRSGGHDPLHPRCFRSMLLCNPYNWWHQRPLMPGMAWHSGFRPFSVGQEIANYWLSKSGVQFQAPAGPVKPNLPTPGAPAPGSRALRVAFVNRTHKRRILNLEEVVSQCNEWVPEGYTGVVPECAAYNFDDPATWIEQLPHIREIDILVGVHGAGLSNSYFMRKGASYVEILPCHFGFDFQDSYYRDPHRIENGIFGFKIRIENTALCNRSSWEEHLEDMNWAEGPGFVWVNLDRDQDVSLDWSLLVETFNRILSLEGSRDHYMAMLTQRPWFFDLVM